jgi:hypothetical protein
MIVFSRENRIDRCIAAYRKGNAVVTFHVICSKARHFIMDRESGSQHKKRCIKDNFRADESVVQLQILRNETEPQQANGEVSTRSSQDTPGRSMVKRMNPKRKELVKHRKISTTLALRTISLGGERADVFRLRRHWGHLLDGRQRRRPVGLESRDAQSGWV